LWRRAARRFSAGAARRGRRGDRRGSRLTGVGLGRRRPSAPAPTAAGTGPGPPSSGRRGVAAGRAGSAIAEAVSVPQGSVISDKWDVRWRIGRTGIPASPSRPARRFSELADLRRRWSQGFSFL